MTPPCRSFPVSELPLRIQEDVHGRRRKIDRGGTSRKIDLSACELFQMLQYKCDVQRPLSRDSPVQCFAVDRLFRKCKDKRGTFTVETTAWEGKADELESGPVEGSNSTGGGSRMKESTKPYQWSSTWHDADVAS